jgi:transposase
MARMRGDDRRPDSMFSYVSAEERIPQDHPLRAIRALVDEILREMSRDFSRLYATTGRPSIPPERLLRAQLLQIFYSIRSERLLMEQLQYNILFRWFVGLSMDDVVWTPTVFTKNRDRLLNDTMAGRFFARVVAKAQPYMSDEHFTVDGTLIEAWASQKSFQPKDGPPPDGDGRNFHGQTRRNATHASTTDPDAKLYRKTSNGEARLSYLGHLLIENRHGLSSTRWRPKRTAPPSATPRCSCCTGAGDARRVGARSARTRRTTRTGWWTSCARSRSRRMSRRT